MISQRINLPPVVSGDTLLAGMLNLTLWSDIAKTVPIDLTSYRVDMHVRMAEDPSSQLVLNFSSTNGRISIGGTGNNVITTGQVPAAQMELASRTYKYDLQITNADGVVQTIAAGDFIVTKQVTRL